MDTWIFYALLAPAVYAVVNFIDKYLLSKEVKDYNAMPIYTAITGFVVGTLFWVVNGFPLLSSRDSLIVIATGILTTWSLIAYFKALSFEETSKVIILFQMLPIVTLLLSFLFLKETITPKQFIGFILIIFASIAVSVEKEKKGFILSPAFFYILIYDILWAASGVLIKFAINANSFWKILSYESWGIGIGGIMVYLIISPIRNAFNKSLKKITKRALSIIALNEGVFVLAKSLTFFAFSLGPVALVSVLENTQTFYGIIFGFALTIIAPSIFKEDISRKGLVKKLVASIILFLGILLLR